MEDTPTKSISYDTVNKNIRKQLIKEHVKEKNKKRVESENWSFSSEYYIYENQMKMIKDIIANKYNYNNDVSKIAMQQINRKIYGYKQQDIIKKHLNNDKFITLESIIDKIIFI